jgi:hypothetical protein
MLRSLYETDNNAEGERGQIIINPQGTKPVTAQPEQAVKRNAGRFPEGFMFRPTKAEKSGVITNCDHLRPLRFAPSLPRAFTEHGAIMLASLLTSPIAVEASVQVVRAFIRLREMLATYQNLAHKLEELEKRYNAPFRVVFDAIRELMAPRAKPRRSIGFRVEEARPICGRPRHRRTKGAR